MNKLEIKDLKIEQRNSERFGVAKKSIGDIYHGCFLEGLTFGDFGKIDIIKHILKYTGKASIDICTWTAAGADISQAERFLKDNPSGRVRFLVDRSFKSRQPKYFDFLVDKFGVESVRFGKVHAKFVIVKNDKWNVRFLTSMNLNLNKRIENWQIFDDLEACKPYEFLMDTYFDDDYCQNVGKNFTGKKRDELLNCVPEYNKEVMKTLDFKNLKLKSCKGDNTKVVTNSSDWLSSEYGF